LPCGGRATVDAIAAVGQRGLVGVDHYAAKR
jgi:hypothetical protein